MKRPGEQWRLRDHVAFFSYRWLAWAIAAITLTLPDRAGDDLPRDAGLLLLIGVITVVSTALAQGYVRLLRQRPALLTLDLVACSAILWLSGSSVMPFLPFALGALILPALAFDWRGALLGAAAFAALDLVGLAMINPGAGQALIDLSPAALGARALTPFIFALAWVVAGRLFPREQPVDRTQSPAVPARERGGSPTAGSPTARGGAALHATNFSRPTTPRADMQASLTPAASLLLARAPDTQPDHGRRVLYDLPASPAASLAVTLEHLATAARQAGLVTRASCEGEVRPLNAAQQMVLLKVAQEALLNVQQHARARSAALTLSFSADAVTLSVEDDGVGLLDGTYERPGLHALRVLRYRLAELEGQLSVVEPAGGGLLVQATLPLEEHG